ncbi:MAG: Ald Xan dh protein [Dehalococcoidia bacterium]|nr:Ald Xan dh protein [Dehalococcoidia bacterium]
MAEYSVLGRGVVRTDARDKVTGRAKYASDVHLPGMLTAKVLRSPFAHARILSIDTSRAERLPGVKMVATGRDIPPVRYGKWMLDRTALALGKVRHIGEPVAAVAAVDKETAEEAIELIRVEYEEIPAVFDPLEAMKPGAPIVHEDLDGYQPLPPQRLSQGNILIQASLKHGDMERGWREAFLIHEDCYSTQPVYHGLMEPHEAVAAVDSGGRATVWSPSKAPFELRRALASIVGLPVSQVRVISTTGGGDFGSRGSPSVEPICMLLAQRTSLPVRMSLTVEEEFVGSYYREAATVTLKVGVKEDGTLVALQGRIVFDTGAYSDVLGHIGGATGHLAGLYDIPNFDVEGCVVYTNNTPRGQCRAPRTPQPIFALESHMDAVARKLGMDPMDFRLKNAVEDGDNLPGRGLLRNAGLKQTLHAVADYLRKEKGASAPFRGWGIACGERTLTPVAQAGPASSAYVRVNEDGTATLFSGISEVGGGQWTAMSQIVAEVLGIPFEHVSVVSGDTELVPHEGGTGGSLTTGRVGTSVRLAAEDARGQLLRLAALRLKVREEELEIGRGQVYAKGTPETAISVADLATAALTSPGGSILGTGRHLREKWVASLAEAKGMVDSAHYCTHAACVEVDAETGQVRVLKYFACHDVGFAINPLLVEGQIEGGVVFGLGYALTEEVINQRGRVLNPSFMDYHLPTAPGLPRIEYATISVPSGLGPFGVKGIGEPPTVPVAPAIANAVYDAVGVRIKDLPLTAEKVLKALKGKTLP